jgi:malto-oligosyltrehalose trehalohydrolase
VTAPATATSRLYPKTWGAEFMRAGEVRFRLWSPSCQAVSLKLGGAVTPMTRQEEGWFELLATGVSPETAYSYVLPDGTEAPDPAARAQAADVHGPSLVVDPTAYSWADGSWHGRPWEQAVIYEIHVGAFTAEGTFAAAIPKLDHLADLGITAVEIMPVAQFAGSRGWGYDGVLLYAPHRAYGSPDEMKALIDAAHARGLMVFLDVVYNHFGPDGNYLPRLAPEFFDTSRSTPWGAAIAYDRRPVRDFFIDNALYWLEEFHLDGLRFDAIDQISDSRSSPHILEEIARCVRAAFPDREVHLITEDNRNIASLHGRGENGRVRLFTAEWNDDFHTAAHVFATGETAGYFVDFRDNPLAKLARTLAEGFAYQGEPSAHRGGAPRGESSLHLPPSAFVNFVQNHDQVGNRALGERLTCLTDDRLVQCFAAVLILSPSIPLLFMGEEWGETRPFLFFTDFSGELAQAVRTGRRREFADFVKDGDDVPDPNDQATFASSKLDWSKPAHAAHGRKMDFWRHLLHLRRLHVAPLLAGMHGSCGTILSAEHGVLAVDWTSGGKSLELRANLCAAAQRGPPSRGHVVFEGPGPGRSRNDGTLPPLSVLLALHDGQGHAEPD